MIRFFLPVFMLLAPVVQAQDSTPSLVVMITIDGFRGSNLEKFGPQLTGGLARLTKGGAWFTNAHQDHAITETAPGHASLLSGRFPRSTGIQANRIGVVDPQSPLLGGSGAVGASPKRFQGTEFFDWLKSSDSKSRALSVSMKDRGAILPIGRAKEQVFWYPGDGTFTTSTYYMAALPDWVTRFNDRHLPQSYAGKQWTLLRPASDYPEPDSVNIEGGGNDYLFPHATPDDPQRAANFLRGTPFMDEITVAFALEGVNSMNLGKGPSTDLLAMSLSATDLINHRLGPDSREAHDQVLRTDRILGIFLDSLFRLRDSTKVIVVLGADHGFTTIPELATPPRARASLADALAAARARLKQIGLDTLAIDVDEQIVLINNAAFIGSGRRPDAVLDVFRKAALQVPGVLRVDRLEALRTKDTLTDPIARRWTHQFPPGTNVALVATLEPGGLWTDFLVASHGSPYDTDSHIPMIFYGDAFKPGKYGEFARSVDIAPTLARVLKVKPSEKLDGVPLVQAIK
jgi:predicted AlkP superfamily pyrophosphatase or phosphodiesterase